MSDYEAIETVVRNFAQGLHEGNTDKVQAQFVKDAVNNGYYEGECIHQGLHAYIGVIKRMPPPILLGEEMDMHIGGIETDGQVAMVRVRYLYEALRFTDHLSLLKIGGEWKIVARLFSHD